MDCSLGAMSKLGSGKFHILTVTRGDGPSPIKTFNIGSRYSVILVNCLKFLSPPGRSATSTVGTLGTGNIVAGVLANSGSGMAHAVYERMNLRMQGVLLKSSLSRVSSTRLTGTTRAASIFTGLAPSRGTHIISILERGKRAIKFVKSKVGSTTTVGTTSVKVSMSATISMTGRSTSVVLLRGSLVILRRKVVRKQGACTGVVGCVGVATSSGFKGVFSMLTTSTLLPFLPVVDIRLVFLGLVCSLSYATVP